MIQLYEFYMHPLALNLFIPIEISLTFKFFKFNALSQGTLLHVRSWGSNGDIEHLSQPGDDRFDRQMPYSLERKSVEKLSGRIGVQ